MISVMEFISVIEFVERTASVLDPDEPITPQLEGTLALRPLEGNALEVAGHAPAPSRTRRASADSARIVGSWPFVRARARTNGDTPCRPWAAL